MAWQRRNKWSYLYKHRRIGNKFVTLYLGRGPQAEEFEKMFAALGAEKRRAKLSHADIPADATASPSG